MTETDEEWRTRRVQISQELRAELEQLGTICRNLKLSTDFDTLHDSYRVGRERWEGLAAAASGIRRKLERAGVKLP
jgi:hypothetical protein